jgi:hypothetical protein
MSERSVLRLLKKNYPAIYDELSQKPVLTELNLVDQLVSLFLRVKGITLEDLVKNRDQSRMLCITVVVKAFDPVFFIDQDKNLMRGLREKLSSVLLCHETQISHTLSTVRTYIKVYKHFREEVTYIYGKTVNVLKDESESNLSLN